MARLSVYSFQKNASQKKNCFLLQGVKVREDLVV